MALLTTLPERSAPALVLATSPPASSARRLESATVVVISSSAAAVSSTEAACCSVRFDRSSAAERISRAPEAIALALSPTVRIASRSLAVAPLKSVRTVSMLGTKGVSRLRVRSPSASALRPAPRLLIALMRSLTSVANLTTL
ncbi:hypothetical protein D9M68_637120 [compost metagenome]